MCGEECNKKMALLEAELSDALYKTVNHLRPQIAKKQGLAEASVQVAFGRIRGWRRWSPRAEYQKRIAAA